MRFIPPSDIDTTSLASPVTEYNSNCVLVFNANDPCGGSGLSADMMTIMSIGAHPITISTGTYVRDTHEIFDYQAVSDEAVTDQARAVLEDIPIQIIKVGFVGSPENLTVIAEISADYPDIPIVAYMPNLSWWAEEKIDHYLDAFEELLLPQTSVLVGNHSLLCRWLLPDWNQNRNPTARDLAIAAATKGVPFTLVTGIALPDQYVDNILASPQSVLTHQAFELFEADFIGAGDTLSAAVTALLTQGVDLVQATQEALSYLDHTLSAGFRVGMGRLIPNRLFWASSDGVDDEDDDDNHEYETSTSANPGAATLMNSDEFVDPQSPKLEQLISFSLNDTADDPSVFVIPSHETKH